MFRGQRYNGPIVAFYVLQKTSKLFQAYLPHPEYVSINFCITFLLLYQLTCSYWCEHSLFLLFRVFKFHISNLVFLSISKATKAQGTLVIQRIHLMISNNSIRFERAKTEMLNFFET